MYEPFWFISSASPAVPVFQYVRAIPLHGGRTLPWEAKRDAGGRSGSDVKRVPEAAERPAVHRSPVLQPLHGTYPGTQENPR